MSNIVPASSSIRFTLTPGQALACYSQGAFKVSQVSGFTNFPPQVVELVDRPANGLVFTSAAFANGAVVEVDAYGGLPCFCEQGTAPVVKQGQYQNGTNIASTAVPADTTLTVTQMLNGRITCTTAAATAMTLPTGTLLLAATSWLPGEYFEWTITNTGANGASLVAGADHTIVGGAGAAIAIPTLTSVTVRTTLVSIAGVVGTFVTQTSARAVS
jgi:uncharacterized protein YaiE (UPF0345 family)